MDLEIQAHDVCSVDRALAPLLSLDSHLQMARLFPGWSHGWDHRWHHARASGCFRLILQFCFSLLFVSFSFISPFLDWTKLQSGLSSFLSWLTRSLMFCFSSSCPYSHDFLLYISCFLRQKTVENETLSDLHFRFWNLHRRKLKCTLELCSFLLLFVSFTPTEQTVRECNSTFFFPVRLTYLVNT